MPYNYSQKKLCLVDFFSHCHSTPAHLRHLSLSHLVPLVDQSTWKLRHPCCGHFDIIRSCIWGAIFNLCVLRFFYAIWSGKLPLTTYASYVSFFLSLEPTNNGAQFHSCFKSAKDKLSFSFLLSPFNFVLKRDEGGLTKVTDCSTTEFKPTPKLYCTLNQPILLH